MLDSRARGTEKTDTMRNFMELLDWGEAKESAGRTSNNDTKSGLLSILNRKPSCPREHVTKEFTRSGWLGRINLCLFLLSANWKEGMMAGT